MELKKQYWAISNSVLKMPYDTNGEEIHIGKWLVYSSSKITYKDGLGIILDGYIMPRIAFNEEYGTAVDLDLVVKAYRKYRSTFVDYVKGMFTVVVIHQDSIEVFNDRFGMKKYFRYKDLTENITTNKLEILACNRKLGLSDDNIALYNLMEHFIDGTTMFEKVSHSQPASMLEFFNETVKETQYWKRESLLSTLKKEYRFEEVAFSFRDILKGYVDCYKPSSPTMTLTGGNDSRAILAALINIGAIPRTFTYGNPKSYDGIVAREIATKECLEYNCYFQEDPTPNWFKSKVSELVKMGNSLINIHRSHRLDAIQQEVKKYKDTDMIFCGLMGGEYIKGINYDDYITPKLLRLNEYETGTLNSKIDRIIAENFINRRMYRKDPVLERLEKQKFFSADKKIEREFSYLVDVVGSMHSYQDTNVFAQYVPVVVNVFMDIDFLELLFSSQYSMMDRHNSSRNQIRRINQPALHCNIINILSPSLTSIEFAKYYTPKEFLGNKFLYFAKRVYRHFFGRRYPENFPYGDWFREYIHLATVSIPEKVKQLYNIEQYHGSLSENKEIQMEKHWHKYSNLVNVVENFKYYRNVYESNREDM